MLLTKLFASTLLICTTLFAVAQSPYETHYFKEVPSIYMKTSTYKASYDNTVSKANYLKTAIKIENLTEDYLLIKKEEVEFELNGIKLYPKKKWVFVKPHKSVKRTFQIDGEMNYLVDKFTITPIAIYRFKQNDRIHQAPDFNLPVSTNEIRFDDFVVKMVKAKKKTQETLASFEVTYNGDNIALVVPNQITVQIPEKGDNKFANESNDDVILLEKGDTKKFKAVFHIPASFSDMQFAEMVINWGDTFQTSKPEKSGGISSEFVLDKVLTQEKNK